MMKANNISFKYYEQSKNIVIENITLEIEKEKISLLIGNSGCGKSTLACILSGLLPDHGGVLSSGFVSIENVEISELKPNNRVYFVSQMFQNADLQFCMSTLRQELIFCLENIELSKNEIDKRLDTACQAVNTTNLLDRKLHTLSGGEKQKCALTCIVALESNYVILDEPFANIDPSSANDLVSVLYNINKTYKTTFLIIDHMIDRWLSCCNDIFLMKNGSTIIKTDITSENIQSYKNLFDKYGLIFPNDFKEKRLVVSQNANVSAIKIKDFSLAIDQNILLSDTNIEIQKGNITALLGNSGSGKTSFLKSLYGKMPYSGKAEVLGINVSKRNYKKLCSQMGIVLQNPANQFVSQNVLDEIMFSLLQRDKKSSQEQLKTEAITFLRSFGLEVFLRYSPYMLSQGQQRRLAVLSVLCSGQKILLLDEPTYGQDAISTKAIMDMLIKKVLEEDLTVLLTTHDKNLAYAYADKIITIKDQKFSEIPHEVLLCK